MLMFFLNVSTKKCSMSKSFIALFAFEYKIARGCVTQFKVTPNLSHWAPIFCVSLDVAVWRIQTVWMSAVVSTVFSLKKSKNGTIFFCLWCKSHVNFFYKNGLSKENNRSHKLTHLTFFGFFGTGNPLQPYLAPVSRLFWWWWLYLKK